MTSVPTDQYDHCSYVVPIPVHQVWPGYRTYSGSGWGISAYASPSNIQFHKRKEGVCLQDSTQLQIYWILREVMIRQNEFVVRYI